MKLFCQHTSDIIKSMIKNLESEIENGVITEETPGAEKAHENKRKTLSAFLQEQGKKTNF